MARSIEISAKTFDIAVEKGLAELGVEREDVTVEIIENAKSGFLGIGAVQAKILMTVLSSEPEKKAEKKENYKPEKKAAAKPAEEKKATVPATGEAADFINKVLSFICEGAHVEKVEGSEEGILALEVVGDNLGGVIGRRGETLDAIQHLANLAINRGSEDKTKVMLDAENYRAKREESLEKFATRAANQAIKYKRSRALEPMNAYERHIVHVALQDMENISTSSVGVEPNRRIVINYTGPDAKPSYNRRRREN